MRRALLVLLVVLAMVAGCVSADTCDDWRRAADMWEDNHDYAAWTRDRCVETLSQCVNEVQRARTTTATVDETQCGPWSSSVGW